ncbi:hypothetical protein PVJ1_00014 [Psychrobacillus phage PVJ1]|nr:hypothetical protein PVJ1_00014 [Psychrobacillus phage PVJ1]
MIHMITTLFKKDLVVCGHLNKQEIASLRKEGWQSRKPNTNKNGIPVAKVKNYAKG